MMGTPMPLTACMNCICTTCYVLLAAVCGALITAAAGALFGCLCALTHGILRMDFGCLLPWTLLGLWAGAIAGALGGGFGRLIVGEDVEHPACPYLCASPNGDAHLRNGVTKHWSYERPVQSTPEERQSVR